MPDAVATPAHSRLALLPGGGAVLGLLLSTRYLSQPFVWANWPVTEVFQGWVEVLWGRLVVCLCMAMALLLALRVAPDGGTSRLRAGLALCAGAGCGELALLLLHAPDGASNIATLLGRMLRWAIVVAVLVALHGLSRALHAAGRERGEAALRQQQSASQLLRMRLLALEAQIEPHFLFNTLATVQHLALARPGMATRLLDHLVTFVRLSGEAPERAHWNVGQEVDLLRGYLGVAAMRMDGRMQVEVYADDDVRALEFPPLLLATLVENAVKHGIGPAARGGAITVCIARVGGQLRAEVRDTGVGFRADSGTGIGLSNSRARLAALHGPAASLHLRANLPHGVVATLILPLPVAK